MNILGHTTKMIAMIIILIIVLSILLSLYIKMLFKISEKRFSKEKIQKLSDKALRKQYINSRKKQFTFAVAFIGPIMYFSIRKMIAARSLRMYNELLSRGFNPEPTGWEGLYEKWGLSSEK